jgi:hypothetical protein
VHFVAQSIAAQVAHRVQPCVERLLVVLAQLVGVVNLENGVLLHHAEEHEDAEEAVEVERLVEQNHRQHRERQGERQREQDGDRVQPRFELRRQDEVHEDSEASSPKTKDCPVSFIILVWPWALTV